MVNKKFGLFLFFRSFKGGTRRLHGFKKLQITSRFSRGVDMIPTEEPGYLEVQNWENRWVAWYMGFQLKKTFN